MANVVSPTVSKQTSSVANVARGSRAPKSTWTGWGNSLRDDDAAVAKAQESDPDSPSLLVSDNLPPPPPFPPQLPSWEEFQAQVPPPPTTAPPQCPLDLANGTHSQALPEGQLEEGVERDSHWPPQTGSVPKEFQEEGGCRNQKEVQKESWQLLETKHPCAGDVPQQHSLEDFKPQIARKTLREVCPATGPTSHVGPTDNAVDVSTGSGKSGNAGSGDVDATAFDVGDLVYAWFFTDWFAATVHAVDPEGFMITVLWDTEYSVSDIPRAHVVHKPAVEEAQPKAECMVATPPPQPRAKFSPECYKHCLSSTPPPPPQPCSLAPQCEKHCRSVMSYADMARGSR